MKLKIAILLSIVPLIIGFAVLAGTSVLYDYNDSDANGYTVVGDSYALYEFIPTANYSVYAYDVNIKRVGSLTGTESYVVALYQMSGGNWTSGGSALASNPGYLFDNLSTVPTWIRSYPSSNVTLSAGTKYSIQIRFPAGDSGAGDYIHWTKHGIAGHNEFWQSQPAGGRPPTNWTYTANTSGLYFRIYGYPGPIYYPGNGEEPTIPDVDSVSGLYAICDDDNLKWVSTDNVTWTMVGNCPSGGATSNTSAGLLIKDTITESAKDAMGFWGMDNAAGRYLVLFVLMLGSYIYLEWKKQRMFKVIIPGLIFGAGLAMGWIDLWLIVMFAIVASVAGYLMLKRPREA